MDGVVYGIGLQMYATMCALSSIRRIYPESLYPDGIWVGIYSSMQILFSCVTDSIYHQFAPSQVQ